MQNNSISLPYNPDSEALVGKQVIDYKQMPDREGADEPTKRWVSWTRLVRAGRKHSFAGIDPAEKRKRRARGKRQRAARKANR
jgi:hypothetical protein